MKSGEESSARRKWFFAFGITTISVYLGFQYLLPLFFPFLIAYFMAWIVRPVTELLHRKLKVPRLIGGMLSLLILIGVVGTGTFFLINALVKQAIEFIKNLPVYLEQIADKLDHICHGCDKIFGLSQGTIRGIVDDNLVQTVDRVKTNIMPGITQQTISFMIKLIVFIGILLIVFIAALLIVKDLPNFKECFKKNDIYRDVHKVTEKLAEAGVAYLRTQFFIMIIVAFICVLGLTILKNDYALLLGLLIAFMDALPVLGSGMIFVPWIIIMLFNGNIFVAAILATIFLLCQVVREVLEPRLIGKYIGINPLFTLIAMYVGVELFSIAGFILGPIGLVIIVTTMKVIQERAEDSVANKQDNPYNED